MANETSEPNYTDYTDAQYDRAEHLVDTRHISYSDAFRIIDMEAAEETTAPSEHNIPTVPDQLADMSEQDLFSRIAAVRYPSELRDLRREVVRGIVERTITPENVERAFMAIRSRRSQLIKPNDEP